MKFIIAILLKIIIVLTIHHEVTALTLLRFNDDDKTTIYRPKIVLRQDTEDKWIEQRLDHFDITNTHVWKQRYFVNDDYYVEGGPIFMMVSGEQFADPAWLLDSTSLEGYMAKKFHAKLIFLEHRYYGMSRPTQNLSSDNLKYLSTYQALGDTAYFISQMNSIYSLPATSKWILFGASYAGSLVAWMRYKYPHLVYAAVAHSAPLLAQVDFQDFYLVIETALRKHSPKCVEVLEEAFSDVYEQLKNPANYQNLEQQFKICDHFGAPRVSSYDVNFFLETILEVPYKMVFENHNDYPTMEKACQVLENESFGKPLERMAKVNELRLMATNETCLGTEKYDETIEALLSEDWDKQGIYERGWIYQTCTEFGWFQSTSGKPFNIPTDAIPIKMYRQMCTDVFGPKYEQLLDKGVEKTNLIYGGQEIVNKTTYTVFVHGSNDPWHAAGVYESNNPLVPVIMVDGGEHAPLLDPPDDADSPSKAKAKQDLMEVLGRWINQA